MSEKQFEALRAIKRSMGNESPIIELSDEELKAIVGGKDDDPNSSGTSSGAGCDNTTVHCHYEPTDDPGPF